MQHFAADRIDLSKLAGRVLDKNLDPSALVDQRRRPDQRGLDRVDAEVELSGIPSIAENAPIAIAADHGELDDFGVYGQGITPSLTARAASGRIQPIRLQGKFNRTLSQPICWKCSRLSNRGRASSMTRPSLSVVRKNRGLTSMISWSRHIEKLGQKRGVRAT